MGQVTRDVPFCLKPVSKVHKMALRNGAKSFLIKV